MANIRQYIGARYVFKIYENSQDPSSAEWEANVTYEPLTIVTYLNSTYASKKDVPGSVGNPAANPQYWVVTGAYNGQIATLQNQIDNLNNVVIPAINTNVHNLNTKVDSVINLVGKDSPKNKRICIVADSYGDESAEYPNLIKNLDIFKEVDIVAGGGWGFTGKDGAASGETGSSLRWLTHFTSYVEGLSDTEKNELTDVYIIGGFNDHYSDQATIVSYISDFFAYATEALPNVKFHVGLCAWAGIGTVTTPNETSTGAAIRLTISTVVLPAYLKCVNYGAEFMGVFNNALHDYATGFDYTNYHPNATAEAIIAREIVASMLGNNEDSSETFEQNIKVNGTETTIGTIRFDGGIISFLTRHNIIVLNPNQAVTSGGIITFSELTISAVHNFIGNRSATYEGIECNVRINASGQPYYKGTLYLDTDGVYKMRIPFACAATDAIALVPQNTKLFALDC